MTGDSNLDLDTLLMGMEGRVEAMTFFFLELIGMICLCMFGFIVSCIGNLRLLNSHALDVIECIHLSRGISKPIIA